MISGTAERDACGGRCWASLSCSPLHSSASVPSLLCSGSLTVVYLISQPFRSFSLKTYDLSSVSALCMAEAVFDDHPLEEYFRRASIQIIPPTVSANSPYSPSQLQAKSNLSLAVHQSSRKSPTMPQTTARSPGWR